ncbi:MFS transporter [Streptomyces sp. NPDC096142]|uniref:MFS transporter n=1 Tax=Streptomyces sp. NPDC096142 TaxID=3366077 RepID=UPI00380E5EF8
MTNDNPVALAVAPSAGPSAGSGPRSILAILSLAGFMANLDVFIVNVAFDKIADDFHGSSIGDVSWVLNAYAIIFAALLVPLGRLADRIGRKRMFQVGMGLFTLASVACGLAPGLWWLVVFRAVQAAGAAALTPTALGLLLAAVPATKRMHYVRIWSAVAAVAAAAGPVLGGLLVTASWRWVFLVNLPIGVFAIVAARRKVPDSRDAGTSRIPDIIGSVLLTVGIAALALAIVKGGDWGWGAGRTIGGFVVAGLLLGAFAWRAEHHPVPVVEPDLYRVRTFASANLAMVTFGLGMSAYLLITVLWMQNVWHWSVIATGFAVAPAPAMVPIVTVLAQRLVHRIPASVLSALGCVLFAAGTILTLSRIGADGAHYADQLLPVHLLVGVGIGFALPTILASATHDLPQHRASTGSAVINMARQIGFVLGISVLVAILGTPTTYRAAHTAFVHGWWTIAIVELVAAVASLGIVRRRTTAT